MFNKSTINKVFSIASELKAKYKLMPIEAIKICISSGNNKIGHAMNVSTMPGLDCGNCSHCIGFCYDVKACVRYPQTVIDARIRNSVLLERDRDEFFRRIDNAMNRRKKNKMFRWHVAGDIKDADYFQRMIDNALNHPDFTIWTYTKMYSIVNDWIANNGPLPSNFTVMFSKWDGVPMPNPFNLPVFVCRLKEGNKDYFDFDNCFHCPGKCDICKASGRGCPFGESAWIDEH